MSAGCTAVFSCSLPSGGMMVAEWPQHISAQSLRMAWGLLDATLKMWIGEAERRSAGEAEYASWFPPPTLGGPAA